MQCNIVVVNWVHELAFFCPNLRDTNFKKVYPPGKDHASHSKMQAPMLVPYECTFETHVGWTNTIMFMRRQKRAAFFNKKHLCSRHRATSRSCVESKVKPGSLFYDLKICFGKHLKSKLSGTQGASTCMSVYINIYIYMKVCNLIYLERQVSYFFGQLYP